MSLIFESVSSLSKYLLVFLKLLKFEVFYLRILNKSETKKNEIANYLKKANILPLPIEKEKKLSTEANFALLDQEVLAIHSYRVVLLKGFFSLPEIHRCYQIFSYSPVHLVLQYKNIKKPKLLIELLLF